MSEVQTTLVLLKPDCVQDNHCGEVIRRFEEAGLKIRGLKMMELTEALLTEHYAHVADKPFFPGIVSYMQETPVVALALEGENAIGLVRDLLGPTDSTVADPGTIRGDFGVDISRNVVHASDGPETASVELERFFNSGEIY